MPASTGHASVRGASERTTPENLSRALSHVFLGVVPVLVTLFELLWLGAKHNVAIDFRAAYWPAAHNILNGVSPYALPGAVKFVYPPFAALALTPLGLIPHAAANWLFTALAIASVPATLWLLGVRDWRVYGIAMLWQPVIVGYDTGNVSLLLLLGAAACWRFRDKPVVTGLVLAAMVSFKPVMFPIGIWLLATRRYRAVAWAIVATALLNAAALAVIGFSQLSVFLHMLHAFEPGSERAGYSLINLLTGLGLGHGISYAIGLTAAAIVVIASLAVRGRQRERLVLTGCVAASLLASPVVESHTLTLILLPLALARPRLSRAWALPVALLVIPPVHPHLWQHAVMVAGTTLVLLAALPGGRRARVVESPALAAPA